MHLGGYVMRTPDPAKVALRYPPSGSADFFMSGEADGEAALGGTAAVIDERAGAGRIVSFGFEPNFRAFTDGTARILRNAILGAEPATFEDAAAEPAKAARAEARRLEAAHDPVRLVVAARGEGAARELLDARGLRYRVVRTAGRAAFAIANPGGATGDEIPWARDVESDLRTRGVPVVMYAVP
jgi:hypothetical protein